MGHATAGARGASDTKSDRDRVIAYLRYAVDDVAELSASSASLLVAAIDSLQEAQNATGNNSKKPS
jgi:hypothetical protein